MQAKASNHPPKVVKPPVDSSNSYIIAFILIVAIAACTRVRASLIGAEQDVLNIQITSIIGKDKAGATNFKNAISLNIGNPLTVTSRDRFTKLLTGKDEFKGEFLGRKISIMPSHKAKKSPIEEDK